jgi:hypothetical protein
LQCAERYSVDRPPPIRDRLGRDAVPGSAKELGIGNAIDTSEIPEHFWRRSDDVPAFDLAQVAVLDPSAGLLLDLPER